MSSQTVFLCVKASTWVGAVDYGALTGGASLINVILLHFEQGAMRASRSRRNFGGWLALFALGLQLTLSFAHIHAEDFARANVAAAQSDGSPQNAPDNHNDGDHDGCAICAVMHMAAASLVPALPSVALPPATAFVILVAPDRTVLPPAARPPFEARAPPQA